MRTLIEWDEDADDDAVVSTSSSSVATRLHKNPAAFYLGNDGEVARFRIEADKIVFRGPKTGAKSSSRARVGSGALAWFR